MQTRLYLFALFSLLLHGCASWVAPLSQRPLDQFHGTRTLGSRVEDAAIEHKAKVNILRNQAISREARIEVTGWNGQVLLTGQIPSAEAREIAEQVAQAIRHVQQVHNELTIGPPVSFAVHVRDSLITTRVKTQLLFGPDIPGRQIKVLTENGTLYLLGLVSRADADLAVQAVQETGGVRKIVRIFEYTDAGDALRD